MGAINMILYKYDKF